MNALLFLWYAITATFYWSTANYSSYLPLKLWSTLERILDRSAHFKIESKTRSTLYYFSWFQADLASLYYRTGVKSIETVFLMTDAHVPDERFLVLINDHLAMGKQNIFFLISITFLKDFVSKDLRVKLTYRTSKTFCASYCTFVDTVFDFSCWLISV